MKYADVRVGQPVLISTRAGEKEAIIVQVDPRRIKGHVNGHITGEPVLVLVSGAPQPSAFWVHPSSLRAQ